MSFALIFISLRFNQLIYIYQRIVLTNHSTHQFECNEFGQSDVLGNLISRRGHEIVQLEEEMGFAIEVQVTQSSRKKCDGVYQYEITLNSTEQVSKLHRATDQTLFGYPLFIRNV